MAHNVQVHIWPNEVGMQVNERGNVELMGLDREDGTYVTIEFSSHNWKRIYQQMGRLQGIGIHKANRKIEVVTDGNKEEG